MAGKVENWSELERLYVVESKSHREIAKIGGISNSTVSQKAKRDDWEGKRIAYKAALNRRGYEITADSVAHEQGEIRTENILVARAYVRTFAIQLAEGKVQTNAKDTLEFIRFLASEMNPAGKEGSVGPKVIEGTAVAVDGGNTDFLRRIVERARAELAPAGGLEGTVLVEPPGARAN